MIVPLVFMAVLAVEDMKYMKIKIFHILLFYISIFLTIIITNPSNLFNLIIWSLIIYLPFRICWIAGFKEYFGLGDVIIIPAVYLIIQDLYLSLLIILISYWGLIIYLKLIKKRTKAPYYPILTVLTIMSYILINLKEVIV
ncbi:hypothetical protein J3E07_001655 [Methanococcus voltae]|uniref:Uncharacterized protein n=1 Tax=Methanococcus voltae TaxID=2188 RepID=A0A8J7RGX7_METVO|nr:hypothetical protein [Methanococcus voltae]MBP2202214.1 hypothetical protein [Methanococcus voltae]